MTANVARPTADGFPAARRRADAAAADAARAAKSDVGEPGEGGVTFEELEAAAAARAAPRRRSAAAGRGGRGPRRTAPPHAELPLRARQRRHAALACTSPTARSRNPPSSSSAAERQCAGPDRRRTTSPTSRPPAAAAASPTASGRSTSNPKQVTSWAGKIAGSTGPALGPDGTLYVSTTAGDLVALEPKTLKVKEVYQAEAGVHDRRPCSSSTRTRRWPPPPPRTAASTCSTRPK